MDTHSPPMRTSSSGAAIPSRLETPPLSPIPPPIETRHQELPIELLKWEDFEKLCLRLARLEADVEDCREYGVRGQDQGGIDLYARRRFADKYTVYQCKREHDFGPAKIKEAVTKFLEGEWADSSDTFVLCTTDSFRSTSRTDEVERRRTVLRDRGIALGTWDSSELSLKLKGLPELVDDFFGREWVRVFCGPDAAESLGKRFDATRMIEFRQKLSAFYRNVFNTHDPGLPNTALGELSVLGLEERYVIPDVYDKRLITVSSQPPTPEEIQTGIEGDDERSMPHSAAATPGTRRPIQRPSHYVGTFRQRQGIEKWLAAAARSIVLGGPGSGKSSLLRFIAIDLLQESPRFTTLASQWGGSLPVWIPFALWTKMIAHQAAAEGSLSDLLRSWFKGLNEEHLWPFIEQALEDKRLLLLVDGLDEWANEEAARIALARLQIFIAQRHVPAVVTSRPHGFDRLGMQAAGWQIGELSDFSPTQQRQLARVWFLRKNTAASPASSEPSDLERRAETETAEFLAELSRSTDLKELAEVPLLLCLLIAHHFLNARLPQGRFRAYDSLIEHLISTHPHRRRTAALLAAPPSDLSDDDVRRILARLAYHVHEGYPEGLIDHQDATAVVEQYLRDVDRGFGFVQREARRYSREVLEVGQSSIGLLVQRSPDEIGYFHRVFQEYLAAYHLSQLPLVEQLTVVERRCADPQWHEVLLGLFSLTTRSEDIGQFIERIRLWQQIVHTVERHTIDTLLCEVACGDFNCPVPLAREQVQRAFDEIELGTWMPQRERLLQQVLNGLRSSKVKELIRAKLQQWFPERIPWRQYLFQAMAKWSRDPAVIECLWNSLYDEEPQGQRAAARSLAQLAGGDPSAGICLAALAHSAVFPRTRAVALEALLEGWPHQEGLTALLAEARQSLSPDLRFAAIWGRIRQGLHTPEDREELLRLGSWEADLHFAWRDELAAALLAGWPHAPEVKAVCFSSVRGSRQVDRELALRILLEGYCQDEDVIHFCAHQLEREDFPFFGLHHDAWRLLKEHFYQQPRVIEAIDAWIVKQGGHRDVEIAQAALVGCTPAAKQKLLSSLPSSFAHWPAWALLEGWGMQDPDVAGILTEIALGPVANASQIAHLLPQIISDKTTCRQRLLEILQDPACERPDFVLEGLARLGNTQGDTEVVDSVLRHVDREHRFYNEVVGRLITSYSADPRVKTLARQELTAREGNYAAVAQAYGDDEEIRQGILDIARPLPTYLRGIIAVHLTERGRPEPFVLSLLSLYDHERDAQVKVQASIGYHKLLRESGQNPQAALDTLSCGIVCYGPDYEERRQAAFCGLVELGRLDVMRAAQERSGNDRMCSMSITSRFSPNTPLLKHLLGHWDFINASLGDEFWPRLSRWGSSQLDAWDALCAFADDYPGAREAALHFLNTLTTKPWHPNILRFLGRVRPKSQLLLEYCLHTLHREPDRFPRYRDEDMVAAELLGEHFGGDREVLLQLTSGWTVDSPQLGVILALCEGWPESHLLDEVIEALKNQRLEVSYSEYFQLLSRRAFSEFIFRRLSDELSHPLLNKWIWADITRPILRRLRTDEQFATLLAERLQQDPTPSEKATFTRFISVARGLSPVLRHWCIEEVDRQLSGTQPPEDGMDGVSGEFRPVIHSLLDALNQPSAG